MATLRISGFPVGISLQPALTVNGTEKIPVDQTVAGVLQTVNVTMAQLLGGATTINYATGAISIGPVTSGNALTTVYDGVGVALQQATTAGYAYERFNNQAGTRKLELVVIGTAAAPVYGGAVGDSVINANSGTLWLSTADLGRLSIVNSGAVAVAAPTSGTAFTATAAAASNAINSVGNSGVAFLGNTKLGMRVNGATSTTDYSGIDFSTTNTTPQARIAAVMAGGGSSLVLGTSNNYTTGITNNALTIDPNGAPTWNNVAGGAAGMFLSWRSIAVEVGFMGNGTGIGGANANDFGIGSDSGFVILNGSSGIKGRGPVSGATLVDMTPDRGTFTMTHTGFTATQQATVTWYRIGNLVTMNFGQTWPAGTSNATTWTGTGMPASLIPNVSQTIIVGDLEDAGVAVAGTISTVSGSGTLTFGKGFNSGGAWTNSGTKGFFNNGTTTFTYLLN